MTITYYGYRIYTRPARLQERIGDSLAAIGTEPESRLPEAEFVIRIVRLIGDKVPISPAEVGLTRRYLIAAGFRSETTLQVYYGLKVILSALMLLVALFARRSLDLPAMLGTVLVIAAAFLGWFLPGLILDSLVRRRQEALRLSLPDALDLMVVCVEVGLGLDQAFVNVSRELHDSHPEVSEEFGLVTLEIRAGKRRSEALHNLAERTGEEELQKLVSILVQADRFGTSIAESLRTHADFMRIRRRQDAEERAGKVGVKLVFPIFFLILPSMLIVTAGPGLLQIMKYLFPMMRNFANSQ